VSYNVTSHTFGNKVERTVNVGTYDSAYHQE